MAVPHKAVDQGLTDLITEINTETNALSGRVDVLLAKISTSMTAEDVATVKADLVAIRDRLKGIGADPVTPIPPTPLPAMKTKH